jgi:hypothetical protein
MLGQLVAIKADDLPRKLEVVVSVCTRLHVVQSGLVERGDGEAT